MTGAVTNTGAREQTNVVIYALAYDAGGNIIGGGSTVVAIISAGGQETVDIGLVTNGQPATVELFARAAGG